MPNFTLDVPSLIRELPTRPVRDINNIVAPPPSKPMGVKNTKTLVREALISKSAGIMERALPRVMRAMCKKAIEGDVSAAKLILDRGLPVFKPVDNKVMEQSKQITITINGAATVRTSEVVEASFSEIEIGDDDNDEDVRDVE